MSAKCDALGPPPRVRGYHGPAHPGHARCVRAAKRAEARTRQYNYAARKRAAARELPS